MNNELIISNISILIDKYFGSAYKLSKITGIDQSNISKLKTGKLPVTEGMINKLVLKAGVNKDWLMTGKGDVFERIDIEPLVNSNDEITRLIKENADLKTQVNRLLKIVDEAQTITKDLSSANERLLKMLDEYRMKQ